MVDKKIITLGSALILVVLTSSFYFLMPDTIRIDFEKTRTIFKVHNDTTDKFEVSGIEYVRLFDGTSLMRANNRVIDYELLDGTTIAKRESNFKEGIVINDRYEFDNSATDVSQVPIDHQICFTNATGKIFEYMIDDITYDGEAKDITSPFSFGKNMKIEFQQGYYSAKVYNYKTVTDKIKIRYKIINDTECFDVRLFDPPSSGYYYQAIADDSSYSGSWFNPSNVNDGDWDTHGEVFSTDKYTFNFNNINHYLNNTEIRFKTGKEENNYTIPAPCWDFDNGNLVLLVTSSIQTDTGRLYCKNATGGIEYTRLYNDNGSGASEIYDIAVYWGLNDVELTLNLSDFQRNITAELNSSILIEAYTNNSAVVCLDIDHPDYGTNYSCVDNSTNVDLNISYFRTNTLNDSSTETNLTYASESNKTIYISGHQYDEVNNLTINLTGYESSGNHPTNVKIYINHTYDTTIGPTGDTVTLFNDDTSSKNFNYFSSGSQLGYITLQQSANLLNAYLNITGTKRQNYTYNSIASSNYQVKNYRGLAQVYGNNFWVGQLCTDDEAIWTSTSSSFDPTDDDSDCACMHALAYAEGAYNYRVFGANSLTVCMWNSATRSYLGKWSLPSYNNNVKDMTWKSNVLYALDDTDDMIYGYNYIGTNLINYSLPGDTTYRSMTWDSSISKFIVSVTNDSTTKIYVFNTTFGLEDVWRQEFMTGWLYGIDDASDSTLYIGPGDTAPTTSAEWRITTWNYMNSAPHDVYLEVGVADGVTEWNYSGEYIIEDTTNNLSSAIKTYLTDDCVPVDTICTVPFVFYSNTTGILTGDDINITYDYNPNPVELNATLVQQYLNRSSNVTDVPIRISSSTTGILQVDDVRYDYAGGNKTYSVTAHTADYVLNETFNITYYYSRYNYSYPRGIDDIYFLSYEPDGYNITPFQQKTTQPIWNITSLNYGGKNTTYQIKFINDTGCVNISVNHTSNKPSLPLNDTYSGLYNNSGLLNHVNVWMWADINCSGIYSTGFVYTPEINLRSCCYNCDVCS